MLHFYFLLIFQVSFEFPFNQCTSFSQAYDPELFSKALPCLSAIGCALSPDYSLSHNDQNYLRQTSVDLDGTYNPKPVDTSRYNDFPQNIHIYDIWKQKSMVCS